MLKFGQKLAMLMLSLADPPRLARALLRPCPQPMSGELETGGAADPVEFPTKEGLFCRGWWIRPEEGADPDRCVVLAHGWTSHALRMQPLVPPLLERGFAVLLYSARSHGNSDWFPVCSAQQFAEDVAAAVAFARRRAPRVAVVGHSLGAAGTILAAADGVMDAAVALASPAHPAEAMVDLLRSQGVPVERVFPRVRPYMEATLACSLDSMAPERRVTEVRCPLLLIHGSADEVVPVAHFHRLCRAAGARAETLLVEGATHDSIKRLPEVLERIRAFLERTLPAGA